MTARTVAFTTPGHPTLDGNGVPLTRVIPGARLPLLDPFLLLDHFGPLKLPPGTDAGFPPHPHKGFMTYTYLLQGAFAHRDSRGGQGVLAPGSAQLMVAGSGIVHEEMPVPEHLSIDPETGMPVSGETGGAIEGFQLWINLPKAHKLDAPRYQDLSPQTLAWRQIPGGRLKALAGRWNGADDPIATPTDWAYAHLQLEAAGRFEHPVPEGWNAALFVLSGEVAVAGRAVTENTLAVLSQEGSDLVLASGAGGEALLLFGRPLGEPVARYGPFVMNTEAELQQAFEEYQRGAMGVLV
jgi:redox-sensitive bicupin YhaK (pirin superfamily)